jgi:hypothetical protein
MDGDIPLPGHGWTRFVSAPGGVTTDRSDPAFTCDRLVIRRSLLRPLPVLKLYDEGGRCVATAKRRYSFREEVVVSGRGEGAGGLLRISRDNPLIELEPSFSVRDPWSGSLIGRFEIHESLEASEDRYWNILDGQGDQVGRVVDPMSWPQLPCRLRFFWGHVEIEPVFSIARPAFSVRINRARDGAHYKSDQRVMAVALAVLLTAVRKRPPAMPHAPTFQA